MTNTLELFRRTVVACPTLTRSASRLPQNLGEPGQHITASFTLNDRQREIVSEIIARVRASSEIEIILLRKWAFLRKGVHPVDDGA